MVLHASNHPLHPSNLKENGQVLLESDNPAPLHHSEVPAETTQEILMRELQTLQIFKDNDVTPIIGMVNQLRLDFIMPLPIGMNIPGCQILKVKGFTSFSPSRAQRNNFPIYKLVVQRLRHKYAH
ncbi:hypothetical protein CDAR_22701 [Caerostris darwini]|uniref:Uncharacterized protein n=1 Tax=Caerostris darwini TaxID=1538125 RepID=A0AAV4RZ62_9ARAC|nr:hypothetical protein CDAR_22701 [Caerostris darwini]